MKFKQIPLNEHEARLHRRAVRTARVYRRCEGKLLTIIEEVDRLELYEKFGLTSTYNYCREKLGLTHSVSYAFQAVARKSRAVPELAEAVLEGLAIGTANRLVAQITPENQAEWIEKARTLTKNELERALAAANPKKGRRTTKTPINETHSRLAIDLPNTTLAKLARAQDVHGGSEVDAINAVFDFYLDRKDPVRRADRAMKDEKNSAQRCLSIKMSPILFCGMTPV